MTKLSSNVCVRRVRVRGGNSKFRALRLDHGNFSWGSEVRPALLQPLSPAEAEAHDVFPWGISRLAGDPGPTHVNFTFLRILGRP